MELMARSMFSPPAQPVPAGKEARFAGNAGHSRSTSAGSLRSDGEGSADLEKPSLASPAYPAGGFGLPEYDYPTSWSVERSAQLPDVEYPAPFIVKNTFIGTDVLRPASLAEFYEERRTQSCPASGISLPPGLEDVIEPEEAAANLVAAEVAARRIADAQRAANEIPTDLLQSLPVVEAPRFLSSCPQQPPLFDADVQPPWTCVSGIQAPQPQTPPQVPMRLQLSEALAPPPQPPQWDQFGSLPCALPAPTWTSSADTLLGSPELPTLGSQGHHMGTCKPCAFFHTKGCGNGVECPFCHLCDAREKKRRMKSRREELRLARNGAH